MEPLDHDDFCAATRFRGAPCDCNAAEIVRDVATNFARDMAEIHRDMLARPSLNGRRHRRALPHNSNEGAA